MFYTVIIRTIYGLCSDIAPDTGLEGYLVPNVGFLPKLIFNLNISRWLLMAHIQGTLNLFGYILSMGRYLQ